MEKFSGWKVAELRKKKGLTQTELVARLHRVGYASTTQTQVSRWESGQQPRKYIIAALAAELGVQVDDLFEEEAADRPPFRERRAEDRARRLTDKLEVDVLRDLYAALKPVFEEVES